MSSGKGSESIPPAGPTSETPEARRHRMRARRLLVIQALAAAGALDMTAWKAQAHGNRSSHCNDVAALAPDDYVFVRQAALEPSSADTRQLKEYQDKIRFIVESGVDLGTSTEYQQLTLRFQTLEHKLQLSPISSKAVKLIGEKNTDAAIAVIEGEGDPQAVLNNYLWSILDVCHLDEPKSLLQTGANMELLQPLASAALDYINDRLPQRMAHSDNADLATSVKIRTAEVLFNIANASRPDAGSVPAQAGDLGRIAAERELGIRTELKQTPQQARSNFVLGDISRRLGHADAARKYLETAIDLSTKVSDKETLAWSKVWLGKMLATSDPEKSREFVADGLDLAKTLQKEGDPEMERLIGIAGDGHGL